MISRASSLQYGHHRGQAEPPGAPPARQLDRGVRRVRHRPPQGRHPPRSRLVLCRPGFGGVGVVRGGQHRVGDLAHPRAVQPDGRVEEHQSRDSVRDGRRPGACATAPSERMRRPPRRGRRPRCSSSSASAATLASIVHGAAHDDLPCPIRSGAAMAISGRCRWPTSPSACRARSARAAPAVEPDRAGRSGARAGGSRVEWCQPGGHPSSAGPTCRTLVVSFRHVLPLGPGGPHSARIPVCAGWCACSAGRERVRARCSIDVAATRIRAGTDPESVSAADRFGPHLGAGA